MLRCLLWTLALAAAASCHWDNFDEPEPVDTDDITFMVREARPLSAKSAESRTELVFSKDSVDFYLEVSEADMAVPGTKGAPVEGDAIGEFYVTSYLSGDLSKTYFNDLKLNSSAGEAVGTGYYWPISTPETKITFFGYAKNQDTGTLEKSYDPVNHNGSFAYALPSAHMEDGKPADALPQPDLLFAIAPEQTKGATGARVNLAFHHALAAIEFKVGDIPADFIVESAEFTGLPFSGDCDFSLQSSEVVFDWAPDYSSTRDFTQTFSKQMSDSQGGIADPMVNDKSQTFIMIPCDIPETSKLVVKVGFKKNAPEENTSYDIEVDLKKLISSWTPGKLYTYKISSPDEIDVEISDRVSADGTSKDELSIENTGLAASYMRAMVVGYWVKKDDRGNDVIVGPWKGQGDILDPAPDPSLTPDGEFTVSEDARANWFMGSDGFYYYKNPVPAGDEIEHRLFESYTVTRPAPAVGAELILSIAVQAVKSDKIDQTPWPVEVGGDDKLQKK